MSSISTQKIKKKIRISLIIRLGALLCVTVICLISMVYTLGNNEFSSPHHDDTPGIKQNHRKLLRIIETPPIFNISEKFYNSINSSYHSHTSKETECAKPTILQFPSDGFTRYQRQMGWILIHVVLVCYCFWMLAIVCEEYLIPIIDIVCKRLDMQEDVAGATFMAAATSSPELFINCVGTFVTKGDLGVGTIVGSAVFNILAVPACCGLITSQVLYLDWWPISRDSLMYGGSVLLLISVMYDGKIIWYESLIMLIAYVLYITVMYYNRSISKNVKSFVDGLKPFKKSRHYTDVTEFTPLVIREDEITPSTCELNNNSLAKSPWFRDSSNIYTYYMSWPITALLWLTIPDCRKYPKLRFFTFIMCMVWIGATSYVVAFLITIIGDTADIPDTVMGLTFLGIGTSIPEAISSIIVTNQGYGSMGLSNSIGSNTFDILFCLALPWFIKAVFLPAVPGNHWVFINSAGLPYIVVYLLSTLLGLYVAFVLNKFRLDWKIGVTCTLMYLIFLLFSTLVELNIFFPVNLPTCDH